MKPTLNPITNGILNPWRTQLPQSVLLYGPKGVGLLTVAKDLASHADYLIIRPGKVTKASQTMQISVERIRELYTQTRTKSKNSRIVIIDDAELMSLSAQNAFLKLLEEPNSSTSFIVTSHQPERLLTTVRSRLQLLYIAPINQSATRDFLSKLTIPKLVDKNQLLFIASGLPAELTRLTMDESALRTAIARVTLAKNILEATSFDKLALITKEKPNRQEALLLIEAMLKLLQLKPNLNTPAQIDKLLTAYDRISGGGNIHIQLITALL